jgi:16S rRNA (cytidine1402-2'-O)-methyltransferase
VIIDEGKSHSMTSKQESWAAYTLVLVPAPLDFGCAVQVPITQVLPQATIERASRINDWICENAKSCRALLGRIGQQQALALPIQQQRLVELPREVHKKGDHGGRYDARELLMGMLQAMAQATDAREMGLVSEAGMPAVADPGSSVVRAAHALGLRVEPLVGPSSLLMALAASGLNGQNFAFVGYLPVDAAARTQRLRALEQLARQSGQTQLFIEVPHRNAALWKALLSALRADTVLSVASGLSLPQAWVRSASVAQWKSGVAPPFDAPCVIGLGV